MKSRWRSVLLGLAGGAAVAFAQAKYDGPRPPKPDVPFLLHAGKLLEIESGMAQQSEERNNTVYTVAGAASPVKTPMAEPVLLFLAEKINPDKLSLFRMTVSGGRRTLTIPTKRGRDGPRPVLFLITPLDRALFKLEVNEYLNDGEYCLSPDGSNAVFCFTAH